MNQSLLNLQCEKLILPYATIFKNMARSEVCSFIVAKLEMAKDNHLEMSKKFAISIPSGIAKGISNGTFKLANSLLDKQSF